MPYYYTMSYSLGPGSVIHKGNWGRLCNLEHSNNSRNEKIFENIRQQKYPNRPSRFKCSFLCPNEDSIRNFLNLSLKYVDLLYEVELTESNPKMFETDWSLVPNPKTATIADVKKAAHKYWGEQIA
ncbi:unnamed protein product [marine sediment metagenome]|uniref:Uncharacterized protein n=1 Tax=marine sediment metagenome TaxID=412755 RepID=X0YMC2_9ZZZZ